mgnify:CR=1 FL=1
MKNPVQTPLSWHAFAASLATFLAVSALMAYGPALAQDAGNRAPGTTDLRFEGVWAKPGSVTLIKQFPKHLVLQGKDEASVWSARCVLGGGKAVCRGHGFTITGYDFAYESVVTLEGGQVRDVWRAVFPDAQDLSGNDVLRAVLLPAFEPARKKS